MSGSCRVPQRSPWFALFPPPPPPRPTRSSLFGSFIGTTARSDPSTACMSGVRQSPSRTGPPYCEDTAEVSRFSCMLFLNVLGSRTTPGPAFARDCRCRRCCLPATAKGSAPECKVFEAQSPSPSMPLSTLRRPPRDGKTTQDSRSGWSRCSFPVGLLHPYNMPVYPGARRGRDGHC